MARAGAGHHVGVSIPEATVSSLCDDAWLLDVREPDEWAAGHAPGARLVPMGQLPARLAEVPVDREVVVVCRSGNRSGQVTQWLVMQGYDARNLVGGMQAWAAAGRPMEADAAPGVAAPYVR